MAKWTHLQRPKVDGQFWVYGPSTGSKNDRLLWVQKSITGNLTVESTLDFTFDLILEVLSKTTFLTETCQINTSNSTIDTSQFSYNTRYICTNSYYLLKM